MKKKILYIDMDSVLADFTGAFNKQDEDVPLVNQGQKG